MTWIYIFSFLIGSSFGSFLNVVVTRFYKKESIRGRSACDHCKKKLAPFDLLPVVSFLLLRGKCRMCKAKLECKHFVVELLLGALFVFVAWYHIMYSGALGPSFIVRDWYIVWVLAFIFLYDLFYMQVDDRIVFPAILTILVVSGVMDWTSWSTMFIGAAVGGGFFLVQYMVSKGKWIGSGDIFIGLLMGVVLGWPAILVGLFMAYIMGAAVGLVLIALKMRTRADKLPFGVYLSLGTFIGMFWGVNILNWYLGLAL